MSNSYTYKGLVVTREEIQEKVNQIRTLITQEGYDGLLVSSQVNLSWLTGGRYFVNSASVDGLAQLWIGRETVELIVNNIEVQRLWEEEGAAEICDKTIIFPWHDDKQKADGLAERFKGLKTAEEGDLASPLSKLRQTLTEAEQERYAALGQMAAETVESVAREFNPGETELEVAGRMAKACFERGMEPIVCLVGADERVLSRRHPLPTFKPVNKYGLLVLGARRWGLVASVSRGVYFGAIPSELSQKQKAVNRVIAAYWAKSQPGISLGEAFRAGQEEYANSGYPEEWKCHHQGGLAGYQSREIKALPDSKEQIVVGQALAWNPTIQGAKAEDTILVRSEGLRNLTATGKFPTQIVQIAGETFEVPLILER
ncbi:M24 family metallopeptidase [Desulfosporosinus sp. FKB]|uniref:M24 family metallopeptidase n=1 Tax=Desulfosporosinus sp. FKB TaxID=1969835 RepID=UPI000B4972A8|nr:M24 family metallopeptidase [Desulfosporosinus sp. FKB]